MRLKPNVPMAVRVANVLRRRLRQDYANGGRLPSEHEMAAELGVSRGTVRQALTILEQEGYITRHQGSGTFANPHVLGIQARIDLAYEFGQLIELSGFNSTTNLLDVQPATAPADVARRLGVPEGSPVLLIRKEFRANDQPAIYVHEYLPTNLITQPYSDDEFRRPMFRFLEQRCRQAVEYILSEIIPCAAAGEVAARLGVAPGSAILSFAEVFYSQRNHPLVMAVIYFRDPLIRFHALRKLSQLA